MLFNSFSYLLFLPIVVALFWLCPQRFRPLLLLIASYVFYMTWKPIYGLLILGLTVMNFAFGFFLNKSTKYRKLLLGLAVASNLLVLAYYKYAYFAIEVANDILKPMGKSLPDLTMQILLPLGISFFVFEFIHYVTDVYKGSQPVKSFVNFALFASFFPTQIAGPIKRYQDFIPQLSAKLKFDWANVDEGINLIVFGLFKKVIFADNLSAVVQSAFQTPQLLSSVDAWMAVYAFAFQIYFDFSGYTDIARGSAQLFGYKVPLNFNLPYLASSIADFWHRWHISLSTWLRDYLFIPLGGSRCSKIFNYRNLFITMVLGGLWHGAAMHFVAWGAYQGIMLIAHKEFQGLMKNFAWWPQFAKSKAFHIFSIVLTFHVVCIGWVFFRADNMNIAMEIIRRLFFVGQYPAGVTAWSLSLPSVHDPVVFLLLPVILGVLFVGQLVAGKLASLGLASPYKAPTLPRGWQAVYLTVMICLLIAFSPDGSPKFIYFQF